MISLDTDHAFVWWFKYVEIVVDLAFGWKALDE